jgi:MarR family transcriptional regulator, transcriptional regulator for hemolysin
MKQEKIDQVIFYAIEKAIKTYRQFAQKKLKEARLRITVDQWLTLKCLFDNPGISQRELASIVFKDNASITRIITLLVKTGYLKRESNTDGRRSTLVITTKGRSLVNKASVVVEDYRSLALDGIGKKELRHAREVMDRIIKNCN